MFVINKTCENLEILLYFQNVPVELRQIIISYALFDYNDLRMPTESLFNKGPIISYFVEDAKKCYKKMEDAVEGHIA
jgi:hypothetical protein